MAAVPTLSYSSARAYQECPLRWKFLYIDRLTEAPRGYFTFGRTIHTVLEDLVRPLVVPGARRASPSENQRTLDHWGGARVGGSRGLPSEDELLESYRSAWSSEGYTSPEEEERYRALGVEILLAYYRQLRESPPTPVAVEQHLEATWDGIPVHGYLDRIDRTPQGGLEILDYKTSRELSSEEARTSDQLTLYQVLVEKNYPDPVEGLTLYHLRSLTPLRTPPRPKETLIALYDRLGSVSDGIRSEAYEPTPGRQCRRCEFQSRCPEFRSVPRAERERLQQLVDRFAELRAKETQLNEELEHTAAELHRLAESVGVHRVPGSRSVAIRRREEIWQYPTEPLARLEGGAAGVTLPPSDRPEEIRRFIRNPAIDPQLRRKVAETGHRQVRWYWEIDAPESPN
ncbi:MAG: RecB family exonuclease [Thermoplasmata archaeon]